MHAALIVVVREEGCCIEGRGVSRGCCVNVVAGIPRFGEFSNDVTVEYVAETAGSSLTSKSEIRRPAWLRQHFRLFNKYNNLIRVRMTLFKENPRSESALRIT